ncbi:hypothetical protein [Helicobacter sp. MIT 05-5294]|uniref:hypothetical protein n=1 Tax=Helicobacter sp. MIT 05-5294 TaxID=1548150 RepID=UPI000B2BB7F2|nr:hypothetical protein [Helicobacter sp. MIT 05-5294]
MQIHSHCYPFVFCLIVARIWLYGIATNLNHLGGYYSNICVKNLRLLANPYIIVRIPLP